MTEGGDGDSDGVEGRKSDSDTGGRREGGRDLNEAAQNGGGEIDGKTETKNPTTTPLHDGATGTAVKLRETFEEAKNTSSRKLEGNTARESDYSTANSRKKTTTSSVQTVVLT